MKNIKHLLTLLALVALGQTAWAQNTIVQNEGDLRNALSNNVTYIDLRADITIEDNDDLVVSSPKVINLVSYKLNCDATHIRVASGGSLVIYSEFGGRIIGRSNMDGRAIYIDNNGSCTIQGAPSRHYQTATSPTAASSTTPERSKSRAASSLEAQLPTAVAFTTPAR